MAEVDLKKIPAVDIMNYLWYCDPEERQKYFSAYEWKDVAFKTTFKGVGTVERAMKYFGVPSLEDMLKEMEEAGYEYVILTAFKQWSYVKQVHILETPIEKIKEVVDRSGGKVIGGVSYNPLRIEESLREIDKAIKEYGFKYIYFHPEGYGIPPNDKRYYPLYAKALEYDVPVGLQTGHSAEVMPNDPGNPIYVDEPALHFPGVKFILSHTGWPWTEEWFAMIWKHPNVYGDISAYPARALPLRERYIEIMDRVPEKILFGTNGLGLRRCKEQFMELPLSDEKKKMILYDNAKALFKL